MNYRMIARFTGMVLKLQCVFMLIPMLFCLVNRELMAARGFAITVFGICILFLVLGFVPYDKEKTVYLKDGFVVVAVCWIAISITGAFPYWISGEIPSFVDALFESTSGFTTTGASILPQVEGLSRGMLLWRSFSHWIGGMGVLVFLLAVVPAISGGDRTVSVMKAESPGPSPGKLVPKLRQSSKILYLIYFFLTLLELILLLAGGMPVFDSVVNAMSTAGTGGFAIKNASIAAYDSAYLEGVIGVFMILFGVNFNVYYFLLVRNVKAVWKSEELRYYLGIIAVSVVLISINLYGAIYATIKQSIRYSFFQVGSVITTTGFATADFNLWPTFSKTVLFILMFIGASAGSTGGGIKVSRMIMLWRESKRILFQMVHPRSVEVVKIDRKQVDKTVMHGVSAYFSIFMMIFFISTLLISINGFDFESSISAVIACLNNIGPGFGIAGPSGGYAEFSALSKCVLSLDMLLGRLEIYPILLLISPRTWKRI